MDVHTSRVELCKDMIVFPLCYQYVCHTTTRIVVDNFLFGDRHKLSKTRRHHFALLLNNNFCFVGTLKTQCLAVTTFRAPQNTLCQKEGIRLVMAVVIGH
jgi:hypothetical protein